MSSYPDVLGWKAPYYSIEDPIAITIMLTSFKNNSGIPN